MKIYQTGDNQLPSMIGPDDASTVLAMEQAGATVLLEDTGREYVVKVREPGQRQIRKASTSGYPVRAAFEAWKERQA